MAWPQWLGDLPSWLTTVAVLVAAAQYLLERRRRAAEEDREAKAQATRLTAWAATDPSEGGRAYGVVLSNTSGSTFHDVLVRVRLFNDEVSQPVKLNILPPGSYFIRYLGTREQYAWEFADVLDHYPGYLRPYMKTSGYQIVAIQFTDNLGQRWSTDHRAILTMLPAQQPALAEESLPESGIRQSH